MTTKRRRRVLGVALLALGAMGAAGCDEDGGSNDGGLGGVLDNIAQRCGLSCPPADKGVANGNPSISGYGPIDSFFRSVINYQTTAEGISADINTELTGIQTLFGITDAELAAPGATLGGLIQGKISAMADIVVKSTPAQCTANARVAVDVSAKCQAEADCNINPGMASFNCMGACTVDADIQGRCSADAQVKCTVTAPDFQCNGSCSGTCTASVPVPSCNAACSGSCTGTCRIETPVFNCAGTCRGQCTGTCSAAGDANGDGVTAAGECVGQCSGTCEVGCEVSGQAAVDCNGVCQGSCDAGCELQGEAALNCTGSCNGSCEYTPPSAMCDARAKVECELNASASAMCTGRCEGQFEPPSANCEASASCQASAKAEAKFNVQCTPPRVEVKIVAKAGAMAQAQVEFLIAELGARLPRLAVAVERGRIANEAGAELGSEGRDAVNGTVSAVAGGSIDGFAAIKIANCTPAGLTASANVIAQANATLQASLNSAASVAQTFDMLM